MELGSQACLSTIWQLKWRSACSHLDIQGSRHFLLERLELFEICLDMVKGRSHLALRYPFMLLCVSFSLLLLFKVVLDLREDQQFRLYVCIIYFSSWRSTTSTPVTERKFNRLVSTIHRVLDRGFVFRWPNILSLGSPHWEGVSQDGLLLERCVRMSLLMHVYVVRSGAKSHHGSFLCFIFAADSFRKHGQLLQRQRSFVHRTYVLWSTPIGAFRVHKGIVPGRFIAFFISRNRCICHLYVLRPHHLELATLYRRVRVEISVKLSRTALVVVFNDNWRFVVRLAWHRRHLMLFILENAAVIAP